MNNPAYPGWTHTSIGYDEAVLYQDGHPVPCYAVVISAAAARVIFDTGRDSEEIEIFTSPSQRHNVAAALEVATMRNAKYRPEATR